MRPPGAIGAPAPAGSRLNTERRRKKVEAGNMASSAVAVICWLLSSALLPAQEPARVALRRNVAVTTIPGVVTAGPNGGWSGKDRTMPTASSAQLMAACCLRRNNPAAFQAGPRWARFHLSRRHAWQRRVGDRRARPHPGRRANLHGSRPGAIRGWLPRTDGDQHSAPEHRIWRTTSPACRSDGSTIWWSIRRAACTSPSAAVLPWSRRRGQQPWRQHPGKRHHAEPG